MLYYFYKITNLINNRYYYGVHRTNNINDGYMGSGVAIHRAYRKYGVDNFKKEILKYFDSEEEMYSYEEIFVNDNLLKDPQCYNMTIGGRSNKTLGHMSRSIAKESLIKKSFKYWHTGDVEAKRAKAREKTLNYLANASKEELEEHHRKTSEGLQRFWSSPESECSRRIKSLISKRYWNSMDEEKRKEFGKKVKNSENFIKGMKKLKELNKGYNNPDFQSRWKAAYEKDKGVLIELLKYSNFPESFIFQKLFPEKNINANRVISYYEHMNWLPTPVKKEKAFRFLRMENNDEKGHKDGGSIKTIYEKEKYHFVFYYKDFFEQFQRLLIILNDASISDSMINNNTKKYGIRNLQQVISYFFEIGFIENIREETVRVWKTVSGKTFTVPAKKTVFDITKSKKVILVDKEFNEYGIDDNGNAFQQSRFRLQIDGKEHFLRCI